MIVPKVKLLGAGMAKLDQRGPTTTLTINMPGTGKSVTLRGSEVWKLMRLLTESVGEE